MTIREIIDNLLKWHAPINRPNGETADTFKVGNPDAQCTGITVTCFASTDVIRKSKELGNNLIICHEPLFWGDMEEKGIDTELEAYKEKKALLDEAGIVVWRDHDHLHGPGGPGSTVHTEIDYIYYGIMKELGWDEYVEGETTKPLFYNIPGTTAEKLAHTFMDVFGLTGVRIVGDKATEVKKVFICEHVNGRPNDGEAIKKAAAADVMIPLEIVDWTLSAYVRDSCQLGKNKAIIEMGHFNTEELGMKYMAKWLPEKIGSDVSVTYVQSGDSFGYIVR